MAQLELIWFPGTCSRVALIALEEIGEPYVARVSPVGWASDPDFLSINPKGKVPVLTIDGVQFTEIPAIMTYLDGLYPSARLLPAGDPVVENDALATMCWIAGALHPPITRARYPQRFCDVPDSAARTRELAARALRSGFELVEQRLDQREWIFMEWSIVDAYLLWAWFRAAGSGMDCSGLRRCAAHARRCEARPSVARALDREEATWAQMRDSGALTMSFPPHQVGRAPVVA